MSKPETTRQVYVDRTGRRITDAASIESRRLRSHLRRLDTISSKRGFVYPETVTAGQIAKAASVSVDAVIEWARDAYLICLTVTTRPKETWWVLEDGG